MQGPNESKPVTLSDVARVAGTSVSTVSLVVNNKPGARIGRETRKRVLKAIDSLGYHPNAMAKNLVQGHSKFIGLIADAVATTPFAGQIIHGAQQQAWKEGYALLIANTEGNAEVESQAIAMMLEYKVKGILYSSWFHHEIELPKTLRGTSTVMVNCFAEHGQAVIPDEVQGGRVATEMLIRRGHRRIAFVNTTSSSPAKTGRLQGYKRALVEASIPFDEHLVFETRWDQEGGAAVAPKVVASDATAVFCHNDRVAMGLYDALSKTGMQIPRDLSVVGFDNQEVISAHLQPPLSTVELPHYEMGVQGVKTLLSLSSDVQADGRILVSCPPIERGSIASI